MRSTNLHFSKRLPKNGFTLLESILALAIGGAGLIAIYGVIGTAINAPRRAQDIYLSHEMARSVLEEAAATFPHHNAKGTYLEQWAWEVTESYAPPLEESRYNQLFDFVELTATVWGDEVERGETVLVKTILILKRTP